MNKTYTERYLIQDLTNKQFKSKYGTMVKSMRTKKQRQNWWKKLSPEKQDAYIDKLVSSKAIKRRAKSIRIMKHRKPADCKLCIHGVTKSCTDNLERGCEYFFKVA